MPADGGFEDGVLDPRNVYGNAVGGFWIDGVRFYEGDCVMP
jgi:hypothetical protein